MEDTSKTPSPYHTNGRAKLIIDSLFISIDSDLYDEERKSFLALVRLSTTHEADATLRQELSGQIRVSDFEAFTMHNKPEDITVDDWCEKAIASCSWLEAYDAWQRGLDVFVALKSYFKFLLYSAKYSQSQINDSIKTLGFSILAKGVNVGYKMTSTRDCEKPRDDCCAFVSDVLFEMHLCRELKQCNKPWCSHGL